MVAGVGHGGGEGRVFFDALIVWYFDLGRDVFPVLSLRERHRAQRRRVRVALFIRVSGVETRPKGRRRVGMRAVPDEPCRRGQVVGRISTWQSGDFLTVAADVRGLDVPQIVQGRGPSTVLSIG